jgi:hypothetical protein
MAQISCRTVLRMSLFPALFPAPFFRPFFLPFFLHFLKHPRNLPVADADVISQKDGQGPHSRPNAAAQNFAGAGLLDKPAAATATSDRVMEARRLVSMIHDVFLEVIVWVGVFVKPHLALAVRAGLGRRDENELIVDGGCRAKPTRMPDRRPALACRFGVGGCGGLGGVLVLSVGFVFAAASEFVLPLQLQFQADLVEFLSEFLVFRRQSRVSFAFKVQLAIDHPEMVVVIACGQHQRSQRGAAQMRTMAYVGAGILVIRIKAELHLASLPRMPTT